MKSTSWTASRKRRYPTTNAPMITVDHLSLVLNKFDELLERDLYVFDKVGDEVASVFPSAEGKGLIWFIEDNHTREVPAPKGDVSLSLPLSLTLTSLSYPFFSDI